MDYTEFLPYIDVADGLTRLQNSKKLYARLLKSFLAGSTNFASIAEALASGNMETAREKTHTFKGVTANLSLSKNFELSRNLEAVIKEGGDPTDAAALLKIAAETTDVLLGKLIPLLEQP